MMTKFKTLGAFVGMGIALLSTSCESLVDDLNDDPNNFTSITLPLALNQAQLNQASLAGAFPAHVAAMWSDQFTGTDRQYVTYDQYGIGNNDFDDVWEDIYQRGIVQAQSAKQLATDQGIPTRRGIALILEGYYFGEAALMFGDVPFSQVNQIDQFSDPTYEPQGDVLRNAIALIDEGISLVGNITVSSSSEQIYSTESTWAQIANGFKARYALGLMDYDLAYAAAVASEMDSQAEDLEIISTTTNFGENLWWQFEVEQRTTYLTIGDDDKGLSYFQQLLSDSTSVSRGNLKTNDSLRYDYFIERGDDSSDGVRYNVSNGWAAQTANLPILTSYEVMLIRAEAALLKGTSDSDDAFDQLNAVRNLWDSFLGGDSYQDLDDSDLADDDSLRRAILTEKYLSVIGLTAFYDVNRTNNLLGVPSEGGDPLAKRFFYPSTEESSNSNFPGVINLDVPLPLYQ